MNRRTSRNKGFTLIELLICMALLSIVMVMVVQFMSSTAGANRKTQYNMKVQSVANEVMLNISESLMRAEYVKVVPINSNCYTVSNTATQADPTSSVEMKREATLATPTVSLPANAQLVPDNYGNYVNPTPDTERKVIIDMDTYELPGEKKDTVYPLAGDMEEGTVARSFRILKQEIGGKDTYLYVVPLYIYAEYRVREDDDTEKLCCVIYKFDYTEKKIFMFRSSPEDTDLSTVTNRFSYARSEVDALTGTEGMLTEYMTHCYLSADVEGNALLLETYFNVNNYQYNSSDTVQFRNSQVLTVRPQNLYLKQNTP